MQCEVCEERYDSKTALAAHIKKHDLTSEEYTIEYLYEGKKPVCNVESCDKDTKYVSFEFKKLCPEHILPGPSIDKSVKDIQELKIMYHSDNDLYPAQVSISSGEKIKWECEKGHVFKATPANLNRQKTNCPCCESSTLCLKGTNSLAATYPELANQWHEDNENEPNEIYPAGKEKVKWKCEQGHEWESTIDNRIHNETGCPYCNGGRTYSKEEIDEIEQQMQEERDIEIVTNIDDIENAREVVKLKCSECNLTFKRRLHNQLQFKHFCPNCHPSGKSEAEGEIVDWLESKGIENVKKNTRNIISPKELDIYLPEYDLAIEYHGLYWHTEEFRPKKYHKKKFEKCEEQGITLLQFFSDQWKQKKDVCKSIILHELEMTPDTIYARDCDVAKFDGGNEKVQGFFEENHLMGQGSNFKKAYALLHDGEIVSCLSVKNSMHYDAIEILRFGHQKFHHIPGALSRLMSYAREDFDDENIVTYADLMHGNGEGYEKFGFDLIKETPLNYWYTDGSSRIPRQHVQAAGELTERQVADKMDVARVYGAGNRLYRLEEI